MVRDARDEDSGLIVVEHADAHGGEAGDEAPQCSVVSACFALAFSAAAAQHHSMLQHDVRCALSDLVVAREHRDALRGAPVRRRKVQTVRVHGDPRGGQRRKKRVRKRGLP
jgi:hypothetical protein